MLATWMCLAQHTGTLRPLHPRSNGMIRLTTSMLAALVSTGCASPSPDRGFSAVHGFTREHVGQTPISPRSGAQAGDAVAARRLVSYAGQVRDAAAASNHLARRMAAAGNVNTLAHLRGQVFDADATAQLARARS